MTKVFSYYLFDIGVAYREDVDEVMAALIAIAAELQADPSFGPDILEPLDMLGAINSRIPPLSSSAASRPNRWSNGASAVK